MHKLTSEKGLNMLPLAKLQQMQQVIKKDLDTIEKVCTWHCFNTYIGFCFDYQALGVDISIILVGCIFTSAIGIFQTQSYTAEYTNDSFIGFEIVFLIVFFKKKTPSVA